jgi:hypothetical protein
LAKTALPGRKVPCCRYLVLYTRGFLYRTRPWTRQGAALQAACTILSGYGGRHWNLVQTGENVWRALCWGRGDSSFSRKPNQTFKGRCSRCCHTRPITRTPPMLSGQTGSGTRGDCSRPSSSWRRRPGSARSDAWRAPAPRACPPRACRGDARGISSCTPCVPPPRSRWGRDRAPAC